MQQVFGITSVLKLSTAFVVVISFANLAIAKPSAPKPIEVLSDPYGYGVPTHYTILRGHTKVTFSNPIFGQFTRAEISMREKSGNRITRFTLSADGKSYRPTLVLFQSFDIQNYPEVDPFCLDPKAANPISKITSLGPAVKSSEVIAKKREELTRAKFFDASCFDPSVKEEHRNAIMNAAADIFSVDTQETGGKSIYLRCLEDNGFAHDSGLIQAMHKKSLVDSTTKPRMSLACTSSKSAPAGQFDSKQNQFNIKISMHPIREDYARTILHEVLHPAGLRDGISTDLIEECCTLGERCDELQVIAKRRKKADLAATLAERLSPDSSIASGLKRTLHGGDLEASTGETPKSIECRSLGNSECKALDILAGKQLVSKLQCPLRTVAKLDSFQLLLLGYDSVASLNCGDIEGTYGTNSERYQTIAQKHNVRTYEELLPHLPVTGPISWDVPQTATPLADVNGDSEKPVPQIRQSRTIASIAPLPEPSTSRSLGSASGRRDVSSTNRATTLVDTLETAARKVTTTLTLEKLDARRIETTEVFRPRTKDQPAQKLIVASLAGRPLQISNIADINDLSFPNPFANEKSEQRTQPPQTINGLAVTPPRASSEPTTDISELKAQSASAIASAMVGSATEKLTQSSGLVPSITGPTSPLKQKSSDREPSSGKKSNSPEFEKMSPIDLKKFVVGSYRAVAAELENQDFAKALSKNGIQIYDHENRQIGAMEPALVDGVLTHTVFIYSAEKSRLIQSRSSKRNPK